MTGATLAADRRRSDDVHAMLLRVAGRLPDELLCEARQWLADGDLVAIAQAVTYAALSTRIPVATNDFHLLTDVLAGAGEDTDGLIGLERNDEDPAVPYGFSPAGPDALGAAASLVPYSLDLTVPYDGPGALDDLDRAAADAVADGSAIGMWRSWRLPARDTRWPPPRRLYLVQAVAGADPVRLAAMTQAALAVAGETCPQVEVFRESSALPSYQRTALAYGALIWSAQPAGDLRFARLFDGVGPDGTPRFADDHGLLDADEGQRVLAYFEDSAPLVLSPDYALDVVDPTRGAVVPVGFRTDGSWIWPDGCAYYLSEYGLAPDPDLLGHVRALGCQPSDVDDVTVHRALSLLYAGPPRSA